MSLAATVRALIAQQARTQPQALYALATETTDRIDYAGLELQCQRVATLLLAQGTQPGDTVSLVMPNGLNTLRLLLGALHGGWCVNPVNLLSSAEQMRYVLEHSDCKLVIASPDWADTVRAVIATLGRPVALLVCSADFDAADDPLPANATATLEPAADAMAAALSGVTLLAPRVPLVANVRADAVTDPETIRALLVEQVTGSVRWRESVLWMESHGVTDAWEIGAGKALSGMIKRIAPGISTRAIGLPADVAATLAG